MKTKLLTNLSENEKSRVQENFIYSKPFRDRLTEVLTKEIQSLQASMREEEMFSSPNWALQQADRVAQTKALYKVISLLG